MHYRWKILAPIELGSDAEARIQHALNTAEAVGGDLTLLYVIDDEKSNQAGPREWPANAIADHRLDGLRRVVLVGPVAETVARYAEDLGADLISLTAGARRWWKRPWRRSIAADIAARTDRPVCFTRLSAPPTRQSDCGSILCVVTLDGADEPVVRFSEELTRRCDATLVLLHVLPEVTEALMAYGIPGIEDRPLTREVAEQRLRNLTSGLPRPHLTAIASGSAYRCIANAAREYAADVIITGRRNCALTGLDAESIVARVSCPLISVDVGTHATAAGVALEGSLRTSLGRADRALQPESLYRL